MKRIAPKERLRSNCFAGHGFAKRAIRHLPILLILLFFVVSVHADVSSDLVELDLAAGSITISEQDGVLTYTQGKTSVQSTGGCFIQQTGYAANTTANTITIANSTTCSITIGNLNIQSSEPPISCGYNSNLVLTLVGSNTLTSTSTSAIYVSSSGSLIVGGSGTLIANGGGESSSGIGGYGYRSDRSDTGSITINSGNVTATSGGKASGVGPGETGTCEYITINGGKVIATGASWGPGLSAIYVKITGGTVIATGGDGSDGDGISSGAYYYNDSGITITGGNVTAIGGNCGAGIESYWPVVITGGVVYAKSSGGSGIGGKSWGSGECAGVTIKNATVTAIGGYSCAGIGGAYSGSRGGSCNSIVIENSTVEASGYVGIGCGKEGKGGTISITGSEITASGKIHAIGGGSLDNSYGCASITVVDSTMNLSHENSNGYDYQELISNLEIPTDTAALSGHGAILSTSATGYSGVTYQWQESPDTNSWVDIPGKNLPDVSILMSGNSGYSYRCKVTNGWGNVAYSTVAKAYIMGFSQQPTSVETEIGSVAALSAVSISDNVTYQWQKSLNDGATWADLAGKTNSILAINVSLADSNAQYRCVITASNGDQLASDSAVITIASDESVTLTVNYYLENLTGTYDKDSSETATTSVSDISSLPLKSFVGFSENAAKRTTSGSAGSEDLEISCYYDRNTYVISYETNGGATLGSTSAKYGETFSLPTPSKMGCTFDGWYRDAALKQAFTDTTMPSSNLKLYAKWSVAGEGRGIEYKINGITLRDSSYQSITAIPRGTFYAEVSVTNLSSTTMDTLLLATYDANGRMLGLSFLYANPQIGQTFVLGTSLDNSKGDIAKIKAFMLPMLGGLTPLAEAVEYGG